MAATQRIEIEQEEILSIRLKLTERDCPNCEAILIHNDGEQCYECLNCGYIDCGDDD